MSQKLHFCTYEILAFKSTPEFQDENCNSPGLKTKALEI